MKKKTIITIMLFAVTLVTLFVFPQKAKAAAPTVKIGPGTLVADGVWHAYNSNKPAISGWTAGKYKLSTDGKTLYIDGIKFTGTTRGIYSSDDLTVVVSGTNTFACNDARGIGLGETNDTLKNLTLKGDTNSTLNLNITDASAIFAKEVRLESGKVNANGFVYCRANYTQTGGELSASDTLQTAWSVKVSGGNLTVTKNILAGGDMNVSGGNVTVNNDGIKIEKNLNVTGGTLTGKSTTDKCGIHVLVDASISGTGKVVCSTGDNESLWVVGTLTVSGGTLEATNKSGRQDQNGASGYPNLTARNIVVSGGTIDAKATGLIESAISVWEKITVKGGIVKAAPYLYADELDISGGSLECSAGRGNAIYTKKFAVSGTANVKATSTTSPAINVPGTINVSGGEITAESDNHNGLYAESLTVSGGTVNATSKNENALEATSVNVNGGVITAESEDRVGLFTDALTVNDGTANGKGKSYGVYTKKLKISGGYVYGEAERVNGVYANESFEMNDGKLTGKTSSNRSEGIRIYLSDGTIILPDAIWISSPSGGYSHLNLSSNRLAIYDSNQEVAKEATLQKVTDISVKSGPTAQMYTGEYFNPSGIALDVTFADGSKSVLPYNYITKDMFSFNISGDEPLCVGVKNLSINCLTKTATTSFTVKDLETPRIRGTATSDRIQLEWDHVEGAHTYDIYAKAEDENDFKCINLTLYDNYSDGNILPGTTKEYYVIARCRSSSGNQIESEKSNTLRLTTTLQAPEIEVAEVGYNSVKIRWDAVERAEKYSILIGGESGFMAREVSTSDTEYLHTDLTTGATYTYYVIASRPSNGAGSMYSKPVSATPTFSGSTNLSVSNSNNGYDLSWEPVDGATGYEVFRGNDAAGARSLITTVDGTEYSDSSADIYTKYNYAVRAYRYVEKTDKTYYGQWSNVAVTVPTIKKDFTESEIDKAKVDKKIKKISKITTTGLPKKKQMLIEFEKVPGVYDYRIEYRKLGDKKWTKKWTGKKNKYTIKNMKNGQFLEFRFAAYKYRNGKLVRGEYSTTSRRWYKTTTAAVKGGKKSITVNIKKVKGATKYRVFYAEVGKPKTEKFVTSKSNKITIKGLKKGKTYIVRFRPIKNIKGKDYHGIRLPNKVKVK